MKKDQQNLVPASLGQARPPVVVVMGHIDHGKSTLLDYIRKTNIVAGEAGGITQHVGAYQAEHISSDGEKHPITFLDTPGHEAFCNIRERGAKAADIAILIVSAEDGVKPQTLEALQNINEQKMPYIVAITKIDKPNANIERTKQSLGENEIYVEGWGGNVPCVSISSVTGAGIPELLDLLILQAELEDLKTDPTIPASGTVIESTLDTRKGVSATLLIGDGTLEIGTFVVAEGTYAPVRFIENFKGEKITTATASMPVIVLGWTSIPPCGSEWKTVKTKKLAEEAIEEYAAMVRNSKNSAPKVSTNSKAPTASSGTKAGDPNPPKIVSLPLVLKADVIGSLEGMKFELAKIHHDRVVIKIVSEGIGAINENDIKSAQGDPNIILIGFNAEPDKKASTLIERAAVPIQMKNFSIIYELSQFVRETLLSMVPKEYVEEVTGKAKIIAVFSKERDRQVVGGKVQEGQLETGASVKIVRREAEIGRGFIRELQQQKKRVTEVREGFEFGSLIDAKFEIAAGDKVEVVRMVEKK
ncbi:MAG: translation initiation factor IF-2 [Candidatus Taylorbacteria bacterium]